MFSSSFSSFVSLFDDMRLCALFSFSLYKPQAKTSSSSHLYTFDHRQHLTINAMLHGLRDDLCPAQTEPKVKAKLNKNAHCLRCFIQIANTHMHRTGVCLCTAVEWDMVYVYIYGYNRSIGMRSRHD